ncbi:MAG: M48 family metallopeptidase, partial [Pirellula sp.]
MGKVVWFVAIVLFFQRSQFLSAQAPAVFAGAEKMREAFEEMGKSTADFMPGFFSTLSDEQLKRLERVPISRAEENEFGKRVLADFEERMRQSRNLMTKTGRDVAYIKYLAGKIQPFMTNANRYSSLDITMVKSNELAAYSIPGGRLVFSTGMIESLPSEAALVGVIGHELSHLDRGHQLLGLRQSKQVAKPLDMKEGMLWMATVAKPMRPEFESVADSDAIRWMIQAGYDARALAKVLEQWDQQQNQTAPWTNFIPSFARSHPDSGKRAKVMY